MNKVAKKVSLIPLLLISLFVISISIILNLFINNREFKQLRTKGNVVSSLMAYIKYSNIDDWETFYNDDPKFSFKYPSDWYIYPRESTREGSKPTFLIYIFPYEIDLPETPPHFGIPISIHSNIAYNSKTWEQVINEKTVSEGVEAHSELFEGDSLEVKEDISIGQREAAEISGVSNFGGQYEVWTEVQMDGYLMSVITQSKNYLYVYYRILSTFSFD